MYVAPYALVCLVAAEDSLMWNHAQATCRELVETMGDWKVFLTDIDPWWSYFSVTRPKYLPSWCLLADGGVMGYLPGQQRPQRIMRAMFNVMNEVPVRGRRSTVPLEPARRAGRR